MQGRTRRVQVGFQHFSSPATAPAEEGGFNGSKSQKHDFANLGFHYTVSEETNETAGPVHFNELVQLYAEKKVNSSTLIWYADLGETWSELAEVKGLEQALQSGDVGVVAAAASVDKESPPEGLDRYKGWADATTAGPRFWFQQLRETFSSDKREESTPTMELTEEELHKKQWHYAPDHTESKDYFGPVSLRELQILYMRGDINRLATLWKEDLDTWYKLVDIEEVRGPVMAYDNEFGCEWKEFQDPDGKPYYNTLQGKESEWAEPEELREWRIANNIPTAEMKAAEVMNIP